MFAVLRNACKPLLKITAALSTMALAACDPSAMSSSGGSGQRVDTSTAIPVALLVPGGTANPGEELLARQLRLAAELAIADQNGVKIDLRVYNTGGNAAQAAQMANKAVDEGAKIILGPLHGEAANAAGVAVAPRAALTCSPSLTTRISQAATSSCSGRPSPILPHGWSATPLSRANAGSKSSAKTRPQAKLAHGRLKMRSRAPEQPLRAARPSRGRKTGG